MRPSHFSYSSTVAISAASARACASDGKATTPHCSAHDVTIDAASTPASDACTFWKMAFSSSVSRGAAVVSSSAKTSIPRDWHQFTVRRMGRVTETLKRLNFGRFSPFHASTHRSSCHGARPSVPSHCTEPSATSACKAAHVLKNTFFCRLTSGETWPGSGSFQPGLCSSSSSVKRCFGGQGTVRPSRNSTPSALMVCRACCTAASGERWQSLPRRARSSSEARAGGDRAAMRTATFSASAAFSSAVGARGPAWKSGRKSRGCSSARTASSAPRSTSTTWRCASRSASRSASAMLASDAPDASGVCT
mmetsp:Transcript_24457/g.87434  ORF Transcript_24457/g.87434 Transcript_24457/m.87434 type:complete len:307 (+) Transcript_24457:502-1422(+)